MGISLLVKVNTDENVSQKFQNLRGMVRKLQFFFFLWGWGSGGGMLPNIKHGVIDEQLGSEQW